MLARHAAARRMDCSQCDATHPAEFVAGVASTTSREAPERGAHEGEGGGDQEGGRHVVQLFDCD